MVITSTDHGPGTEGSPAKTGGDVAHNIPRFIQADQYRWGGVADVNYNAYIRGPNFDNCRLSVLKIK